jgi:uncharacterized protein YdeI (YjbR/CyaY-like superfamily)
MITSVDAYLAEGCGRCSYYNTPQCKVNNWLEELVTLRSIVLKHGLKEEVKWSQPCYTLDGKNVLLVAAFKDYATVAFFKGSLLKDSQGLLHSPGKSSQAARQLRFTSVEEIIKNRKAIDTYIEQAILLEKEGKKVEFSKDIEELPDELEQKFIEDPAFEKAFKSLTPGRQRGYILHFSQPKQSTTRVARIEKYYNQIMAGQGIHDAYRQSARNI